MTITDNHGWTLEQLKAYEKKVKKGFYGQACSCDPAHDGGYYACEASKLLNVHRDTISAYVRKFNQGGMDALLHRGSSPGKPPLLSPEQEAEVRQMIEHSTPAEEGFGCESSWDTRILKHVLEEKYAITMTRMGIGKMLKRWGFSYTRPTYTLKRADPGKQAW